jgi:integrase
MHSSGASLKVAQAQLRHADASTTSRYYLRRSGEGCTDLCLAEIELSSVS